MRLTTLTLLAVLASPAVAQDTTLTGPVSLDAQQRVVLGAGKVKYHVTGDVEATLRQIIASNPTQTPRTVTLEGELGKIQIGAQAQALRGLDAYALTSPRSLKVTGVLSAHAKGVTLQAENGPAAQRNLKVTGVPQHLLQRLDQRRVVVSGWLFGTELQLTSAQATVTKDGWLSERRQDPKTGAWQYRNVGEVTPGQPVQVLELAAYSKAEKAWRPISDMKDGDLVFAKVGVGRPDAQGGHAFVGWMPVFKLSFGEEVRSLPEQQSADMLPPQQQSAPVVEPAKKGAKQRIETEITQPIK